MKNLHHLNSKKILIYGYGKTGKSLFRFFKKNLNSKVKVFDDNLTINKKYVIKNVVKFNADYIFLSPGINIYNNKYSKYLKRNKKKILTDIDLFCSLLNETNKVIGVTGTNGKSTYCKILSYILKKNNIKSKIVGNFGLPVLNNNIKAKNRVFIVELSSYQLDYSNQIKLDKAIILNMSPDHLDRHDTMSNYVKAKFKIFRFLKQKNHINGVANDLNSNLVYKKKASKTINISKFNNDVCLDKKFLKLFLDKFKIKNYKLQKNEINLPHRNEIIRNYKNFIFINDSKSTNSASLKYSLSKYDNIILICGGLIKKGDNWQLGKLKKKIKITYIIGKEPAKIIYSLKKQKIKYFVSEKLSKTIDIIKEKYLNHEKKNKIKVNILFSPGTSSYDQYKNFEMRGNHFKKLINAF